jgi:hypothetical protein
MRISLSLFAAAAVLSFVASPALADRATADACAAKLPANSKLIYTASVDSVKPGADLTEVVRGKTRGLVMSGKLSRGDAQGAAQTAGKCLMLAQ